MQNVFFPAQNPSFFESTWNTLWVWLDPQNSEFFSTLLWILAVDDGNSLIGDPWHLNGCDPNVSNCCQGRKCLGLQGSLYCAHCRYLTQSNHDAQCMSLVAFLFVLVLTSANVRGQTVKRRVIGRYAKACQCWEYPCRCQRVVSG